MGLTRLTLVKPRTFPAPEAENGAQHPQSMFCRMREFVETVEEAIADAQFVVGTSARERRIPWPVQDARHCGERIVNQARAGESVAILFGRGGSGTP